MEQIPPHTSPREMQCYAKAARENARWGCRSPRKLECGLLRFRHDRARSSIEATADRGLLTARQPRMSGRCPYAVTARARPSQFLPLESLSHCDAREPVRKPARYLKRIGNAPRS